MFLHSLTPSPLQFCYPSSFPSLLKLNISRKVHTQHSITCLPNPNSSLPTATSTARSFSPPVAKKRKRYQKPYPGELEGITQEMRFVTMKLRNVGGKYIKDAVKSSNDGPESDEEETSTSELGNWVPSTEGFLKYLVDSKLIFDTVERIIDKSEDVAYAYFIRNGLERSDCLAEDLKWFSEQNIAIPEPSEPGATYADYLKKLANTSAPLFLSHFYNIYFSHIAGGQVIAKQVSEKLFEGREFEFYRWQGNVEELLRAVRNKLDMLGEYWTRDEKNKCLSETRKSFKYMGKVVRLIIS